MNPSSKRPPTRDHLLTLLADAQRALDAHDLAAARAELDDARATCRCDPASQRYDIGCRVADAAGRVHRLTPRT